ncbi:MAG TPA: DNA alkylation repair protein [Candidatus Paceibacterota bacterium]|nr:DNA alkylation repair protein [Candidatus Pacearchaeota archaeon]HRZ50836.1 DNA alkylation repair protein [Candidatus Paceibacterota bacterium]HSA36557.1 DNA alkylation repair protein [Candidatus Paceibacterota bacterium]
MDNLILQVKKELISNSDAKTKDGAKRFFKESVKLYGVKTATVSKIAREYFKKIKNSEKAEILGLCENLWQSGYMENSFIACNWSFALREKYEPKDFELFESWINGYISNWATCDTFCNHTMGTFLEMYPQYLPRLKEWAKSKNRWTRRAAAVSLIVPAKRGKFLKEILGISDILLCDPDDMAQKGYGWLLKVASQAHQREVFDYVMANKSAMPRTALRYAIEKMPKSLKEKAMDK